MDSLDNFDNDDVNKVGNNNADLIQLSGQQRF